MADESVVGVSGRAVAEPPPSLGDFFAKKNKKKVKGSNLNNECTTAKPEEKKPKSKEKEEEGWEEEQIVAPTMKGEVVGKLTRDEDKKEEEDAPAPAWGSAKVKGDPHREKETAKQTRDYPTLAKAVQSTNINLDDGTEAKVNIKTTKNAFAALEGDQDDDEDGPKRPKEIKPAMVRKQQGEREKAAVQREVDKYTGKKDESKAKRNETKKKKDDDEEEDDDEEVAEEPPSDAKRKREAAKKQDRDRKEQRGFTDQAEAVNGVDIDDEKAEDLKIQPDRNASKAKYKGRRKLPPKDLPASEMEEERRTKPQGAAAGQIESRKGKRKNRANLEEDEKPELQFLEED